MASKARSSGLSADTPQQLIPLIMWPQTGVPASDMSEVGGVRLPMGPAFGPVLRRSTSVEKVRMSDPPHA